ncbi:MAG: ERAP1-like C-terminal domain-containing protein, partial [Myxococcota bacterium]
LYERYLERALAPEATPDERGRYLSALACFRDRELIERTLTLYPEGKVRGDEMFFVYGILAVEPALADRLLDWMISNYARIESDLPPEFRTFLIGIGGGCDTKRFDRAVAFFSAPQRKAPGADRRIGQTGDQVRSCVALREREGAAAERFLAAYAAE